MNHTQVREMFERIAFSYDMQNSLLSLGVDILWRGKLAAMVPLAKGDLLLDAATGTGEAALDILGLNPEATAVGVDFSPAMLARAMEKKRSRPRGARLALVRGDCRSLPLPDNLARAVTIAFGIRNIPERGRALAEFLRVLAPGGRLLAMEFGLPDHPVLGPLYRLYFDHLLPPLGNLLSRTDYAYTYLRDSVRAFPEPAAFEAEIREAGFTSVRSTPLTWGTVRVFQGDKPATTTGSG